MAVGLVARELHQPLPVVKALPLKELMLYARLAAAMSGRKF
jgi:hypothetical protein